jgi:CRISPR-associated protein Csm1
MVPEVHREYQTVILGALLQDIGKYFQRGQFGDHVRGRHPQVGAIFVRAMRENFARCCDADLLETLVQRHHESPSFPEALQVGALTDPHLRTLCRLVSRADNLASSERLARESASGYQPFRTTALAPIFERIELRHERAGVPRHFRQQPLTEVGLEPPIFPVPGRETTQEEVTEHVQAFGRQFERLRQRLDWDNFDCVYSHILSLLQAYAWCIPSDTQSDPPDVSLYDHLRATSAIAACLYQYHARSGTLTDDTVASHDQTRCILLVGDLSGIQDYIFAISRVGPGGVAKRLRARSFYVQLLSDAATFRVLRCFALPYANVLMASGGKFYVLLPNFANASGQLTELQREFDHWLLRHVHGALALNLAWVSLADKDFAAGKYGSALARLHGALALRKSQKLGGVLQNRYSWSENFTREAFAGEDVCLACRRFPAVERSQDRSESESLDVCFQCSRQLRLGRRLTRARYISFFDQEAGEVPCLGLSASVDDKPQRGAFWVLGLNDPDLGEAGAWPASFRYLANYVPREKDGSPRDFGKIAGAGLLGVLKADVDHLGQIFQEGLQRDAPAVGLDTVSRLAALSRQLDWFFSGWLEWLLRTTFTNCYIVYSGGDDLLVVGSRGDVLPLAKAIHKSFACYTQQADMTISAGIAIVQAAWPLAHTVTLADQALEKAKESGRDRLCLLGECMRWDECAVLDEELGQLSRCEPAPPTSFFYRLLYVSGLWRRFRQGGEVVGLRYHSILAYYLARNVSSGKQRDLREWTVRLLKYPPDVKTEQLLNHLRLIAQWRLLEKREKGYVNHER